VGARPGRRAEHEGVGLSRSWFCHRRAARHRNSLRHGAVELLIGDDGRVNGVKVRDDDGMSVLNARSIVLGCGGFEANVQMRTSISARWSAAAKVRGTPHTRATACGWR